MIAAAAGADDDDDGGGGVGAVARAPHGPAVVGETASNAPAQKISRHVNLLHFSFISTPHV